MVPGNNVTSIKSIMSCPYLLFSLNLYGLFDLFVEVSTKVS